MATHTLWYGSKSFIGDNNYETVEIAGEEIGAVRFTGEIDVQYRVFKLADGESIIVYYIERDGYNCTAEIFKYPNLEEAAAVFRFVLKKAGVI